MNRSDELKTLWQSQTTPTVSLQRRRLLESLAAATSRFGRQDRIAVRLELAGAVLLTIVALWLIAAHPALAGSWPVLARVGLAVVVLNAGGLQASFSLSKAGNTVGVVPDLREWLTAERRQLERLARFRYALPWFVLLGSIGGLLLAFSVPDRMAYQLMIGAILVLFAAVVLHINAQAIRCVLLPATREIDDTLRELTNED